MASLPNSCLDDNLDTKLCKHLNNHKKLLCIRFANAIGIEHSCN